MSGPHFRAKARYHRVHHYGGGDDMQMLIDHADEALELAAELVNPC